MKIRKRMLAGIVALTMTVTTLAGWTSQDSASAQSSSNAAADTAAVNYDLSASDITMTADLSYVVSDSEVNTVTLTLEGGTFKEGIGTDDIRLDNALKGLQGTLRDAKKAYALTYWVKGDVLPTGYAITDAKGNELASDAEIPDDYKISTPDGLKNPSDVFGKILDLDTATDAQVGEYNQEILDYIADQASKNNPVFTQFNNNVAGFELALSNALDLVNNVGSSYHPFDAFDIYCAKHYNFDSQSYGPRVAIREDAAVTFTQSMAVFGVVKNIAKYPEQSVYIGMNKKYHAAMEKIDSSVPAGHGTGEILAYPHGGVETEVSTGKYIKDVKLAGESSVTAAKNDLNKSAGGAYIYLGYKTTTDPDAAIRKLFISKTKNTQGITSGGIYYNALPNMVNLNSGINADKYYLYYTKDAAQTSDEPLTAIWFNNYSGNSLMNWNLNGDTDGDTIYLHYANAFDSTTTEVVPDENDPEYYPYCYTLGKKVYLLDSKTYDVYGISLDHRHYNFTSTQRDEFISRMQNSSIRDELYDAGLLRDEELFNDLKNLPLSTSMSRTLTLYDPFNGQLTAGHQQVNISAIESAGKSIVNYNPGFDVHVDLDYTLHDETRYQEFLMLAAVDTDYSATRPVEANYAKELASKFENNKLTYMMDIGGSYTTSAASKVVFYNANGTTAGTVNVADTTPSTNPMNGDTYYELSCSAATAADAEKLTARFYYNEQDYFDLTPYKEATFTVTWKNEDGTVLEKDERVPYGTTPQYNGAEPKKAADNDYVYIFKGVTADTAYIAQYDAFSRNNTVTVKAQDVNGDVVPANLTGGGEYEYGASATLTAPQIVGYNFMGWYDSKGERCFTTSTVYKFTVTEPVDLIAKYKAIAQVKVEINGGAGIFTINGNEYSNSSKQEYMLGTRITVVSNDPNFSFWRNSYGMVVSRSKEYTFTVTGTDIIQVVSNNVMEDNVTIVFESAYNQIMASDQITRGQTTKEPALPTYNGNTALGWDYDCDGIYDPEKDTLEAAVELAFANDAHAIVIRPVYRLNDNTYYITVNGGAVTKGEANVDGTFTQNTVISVTADEPVTGQKFSHWRDGAYKVVSYNKSYSFFADDTKYSHGYFYYHVHEGYVSICGYFGGEKAVEIPSSIAGKPVSEIEHNAFKGCSSIEQIEVHSGEM